jgi:hypothetical protein
MRAGLSKVHLPQTATGAIHYTRRYLTSTKTTAAPARDTTPVASEDDVETIGTVLVTAAPRMP